MRGLYLVYWSARHFTLFFAAMSHFTALKTPKSRQILQLSYKPYLDVGLFWNKGTKTRVSRMFCVSATHFIPKEQIVIYKCGRTTHKDLPNKRPLSYDNNSRNITLLKMTDDNYKYSESSSNAKSGTMLLLSAI